MVAPVRWWSRSRRTWEAAYAKAFTIQTSADATTRTTVYSTTTGAKVLNRTNGRYPDSQVYWSFNGQTHSIAEQPYLDMPVNSAGRMYDDAAGQSSFISHGNPQYLLVAVGW